MKKLFNISGFTLIELMIFIAILAIIMLIGTRTHSSYQWLTRENNYSNAIRQIKWQKKEISSIPFDKLPPELLSVDDSGKIKLSNRNILSGSVSLFTQKQGSGLYEIKAENNIFEVEEKTGIITIKNSHYRGKKILVTYSFLLPDRGEGATVPSKEPYEIRLFNNPVKTIMKIELAEGNSFRDIPVECYKIKAGKKEVIMDKKYGGKTVRITYTGDMIKNICTGEFLYDDLRTAREMTGFKMIKILEDYGSLKNIESAVLLVK